MRHVGRRQSLADHDAQEQVNGAQVSAVLKQVVSETVAKGVGMDPILEAGVLGSSLAGIPHCFGGDGMRGGMPAPARDKISVRFCASTRASSHTKPQ